MSCSYTPHGHHAACPHEHMADCMTDRDKEHRQQPKKTVWCVPIHNPVRSRQQPAVIPITESGEPINRKR